MSSTTTDTDTTLNAPAGQDQVENDDLQDNLQDADTLADIRDPVPADTTAADPFDAAGDNGMDAQTDGDRQLSTASDALDTGLNDSDLGAEAAGLDPERERYAAGGADALASQSAAPTEGYAGLGPDSVPPAAQTVTGGATGLGTGVRE